MDNSEGVSYGELDSSQQLKNLKSHKIVNQGDQISLSVELSNSTIVFANNHTELISTSTFL